ncbi:MAG: exo-alpha-sialidase [Opitutaceae bacterium]|nr:exo-alpha-sialidase [Opitutaceae bacterium]
MLLPVPPALRSLALAGAAVLALLAASRPVAAAAAPAVRVENIRRAFHNGEHNAFTDLIRWRGQFWLTFRSCPDGHGVYASASVVILTSADAKTWRQVHRFSVADRDTRDPHFLVFKDRLFVYTGAAYVGKEKIRGTEWNAHFGYGTSTADGTAWTPAQPLEGTYGHYVWRAAASGDRAYLIGRRFRGHMAVSGRATMESALLESDDGFRWRFRSLIQETDGNETALHFEPDGTLLALCRTSADHAVLARSRPPYETWSRTQLDGYLGGPMLARWGDRYLVGGRRRLPAPPTAKGPGQGITTLLWLSGERLEKIAELPSSGDNSYPGFVALDDRRGLLSWYSTHEKDADGKPITAIYVADLVRTP